MTEEWKREMAEIPIEERLGNMLEISVGITEDLTDREIEDLTDVLPDTAGKALRNILLTDPSLKKLVIRGVLPWLNAYVKKVREAHSQGKKLAFSSFNTAPEVLWALDCVPLCPEVFTSTSEMFLDGAVVYQDWSVEEGLLETMCTAQRGHCGAILKGRGLKPDFCYTNAPGSCDQNAKLFEYMALHFDIPYLGIDCPTHDDERSLEYYRKDYRMQISRIEEITGNKLDYDRLKKAVEESEKCREYYREITDLARARPNPVPNIANVFYHGMKYVSVGTEEGTNLAKEILDCSKERLKLGLGVKPKEKIRQAWLYTGYYYPSMDFWFWLERNGMSYITDVLTLFYAEEPIDTSSIDSMIDGLARRSSYYPMTKQMRGPMDYPGGWLEDYIWIIKEWDIDCCIWCGHLACKNAWGAVVPLMNAIREATGIPSLRLEADGWDYRITPFSTTQEKIEEFNETMGLI